MMSANAFFGVSSMFKLINTIVVTTLCGAWIAGPAVAADRCATPEQTEQIREYYAEKPGAMPVTVARTLGISAEVVTSGLPADQAISVSAESFTDVWALMSEWTETVFVIMNGDNIFEVLTGVGTGRPSATSDYFNIDYRYPLRGHLRPDRFGSIYAVAIPRSKNKISRGVLIFDQDGALLFGTYISGNVLSPSDSELAKFDKLWAMIEARSSVCPRS